MNLTARFPMTDEFADVGGFELDNINSVAFSGGVAVLAASNAQYLRHEYHPAFGGGATPWKHVIRCKFTNLAGGNNRMPAGPWGNGEILTDGTLRMYLARAWGHDLIDSAYEILDDSWHTIEYGFDGTNWFIKVDSEATETFLPTDVPELQPIEFGDYLELCAATRFGSYFSDMEIDYFECYTTPPPEPGGGIPVPLLRRRVAI